MIDTNSLLGKLREEWPEFDQAHTVIELVRATGDLLEQMRLRKGLSQIDVAKALGVSSGRISQLESGTLRNAPSLKTIAQFANACGETVSIDTVSERAKDAPAPRSEITRVERKLDAIALEIADLRSMTEGRDVESR